jgi:hypothetical protein
MPSSKEEKPNPTRELALSRIAVVVSKYKIIKLSVLIQDVVKHTFGDTANKDSEKADRAHKLIAGLINSLVEDGTVGQFNFSRTLKHDGSDRPSTITETIIVEGGFSLNGYVPETPVVVDSDTQEHNEEGDDDDGELFSSIDEDDFLEILEKRTSGFAIINYKGNNSERELYVKSTPNEALGKYLNLIGEDGNSPDVFALVPVELEIKSMLGKPVEVKETEGDVPEVAAG